MIERVLVEIIAKENDFTIISKLDDNTKEYLKEHIQNTILERYEYTHIEHLQEMILTAIELYLEDTLLAINYIKLINYNIDDDFYEKLQEPYFNSNDDDICDWEDEFEKDKKDIRLNKYTLGDFIKFNYVDGIDFFVKELYKSDVWKQHSFYEDYEEAIKKLKELYHKLKNREIKKNKDYKETINDIFNQETLDIDTIQLKKDLKPLSKRETTLITAYTILHLNKDLNSNYKERIQKDYNINTNSNETNQELLNNSYDVIIYELQNYSNTKEIISLIENEKSINSNLFTNGKKLTKVKSNNHYMSFLYKCNSVYTKYEKIVFKEFVEALISGYMQYLEFDHKEIKLKNYKQDLEVLERYNSSNENDKNIQELENNISFLSIPKPHHKFIPFKELSNKLEIDTNTISNYITNILNNGTHKNTIKKHFDTLQTIPKEICISRF